MSIESEALALLAQPAKVTVPQVLPLIERYYADYPSGGSLHIILEDGNCQDYYVESCIRYAEERGDRDGLALAKLLGRMSYTQRNKLHAADKGEIESLAFILRVA